MPHPNLTRDEAVERAATVHDVAYAVDLDLRGGDDPDTTTFRSTTTVSFTARQGASTFLDLRGEVLEATLNGELLPPDAHDGGRLRLDGLDEHNVVEVSARCPYARTGVGLHRFIDPTDGSAYLHTQFEPVDANRVLACFDQPDLKAPLALTVTAPRAWTVVSNQPPEGEPTPADGDDPANGRTWRFGATPPLSTYLYAVCAGPFHSVHDTWEPSEAARKHGAEPVRLGIYCRGSMAEHLDADEILTVTKQGLDWFTTTFGHPYPFADYEQLFVPEFNWGAMEHPGCVTFTENYVFRSRVTDTARQNRASTILHEMAHMWFGDLVTMRWWDDLWLNESFATYAGTRALAEATRFSDAWASFSGGTKAWAVAQDQLPSTHPIAADIPDAEAVRTHFDGITYAKGASVLAQLVAWVGDDAFTAGLSEYFRRHAWGNAELGDFLGALEDASGRDLAHWSRAWLETAGVATLRAEAEAEVEGDQLARVRLRQDPDPAYPTIRPHRLGVGCYDDDGETLVRRARAEIDLETPEAEVAELAGERVPDLLLPNDGDLTYGKLRVDDRSLATLEAGLSRLPDPLARTLAWGAAWDMLRDAELSARRFVALIAAHAPSESHVPLLQLLTRRAHTALGRYTAPPRVDAAAGQLWRAAQDGLVGAAPGSDHQLVWVRFTASVARTAREVAWVQAILDGDERVDGLTVDTELRWHLVRELAAHGRVDDARIAAEERRDPTDMGARQAAAARAAQPEREAKRWAWERLVVDEEPTLALRRAIAEGLWQPGQDELVSGLVAAFPGAAARIWAERDGEEALSLTARAYPSSVVSDDAVAAADAALARDDLPGPARRTVAEQRDETLRALRARAADTD